VTDEAAGSQVVGVIGEANAPFDLGVSPSANTELDRLPLAVLIAVLLGLLLAALDQTIVSTALPTIGGDLGHLDRVSWVATSYLLTWAVATPIWGKLGDMYGRRRVYMRAIVMFLVASWLCGLVDSLLGLTLLRGVQGAGAGGLMVGAQGIIGDVLKPSARARYTGLVSGVFVGATVTGPFVGGWLVDHVSWRAVFYLNVPLGAVALLLTLRRLPRYAPRHTYGSLTRGFDLRGALLLSASVTALTLLISSSSGQPAVKLALLATCVLAGAAFLYVETIEPNPLLPLYLLRGRVSGGANLVSFMIGMAWFGLTIFLPLYFQVVRGASATTSGLRLMPLIAGLLVSSTAAGRMLHRDGRWRSIPIVGTTIATMGIFAVSLLDRIVSDAWMDISMLMVGLGVGLVTQVMVVVAQNAGRREDLGAVTATVTFSRAMGSSIGVSIMGSIFASRLDRTLTRSLHHLGASASHLTPQSLELNPSRVHRLPSALQHIVIHAFPTALHPVFLTAAVFGAGAAASAWLLPRSTSQGNWSGRRARPRSPGPTPGKL
jgi:EmrB/QacA subfamily drug resistance transporter